ncbi:MAG: hypothetical protein RL154_276 [Pseudomonadota bacterium]|jgi:cellulose biosynthesis protein BcsQ
MKKLKALVINSKGGVGKSTVAMQLLAPYIYEKWQTKALLVELDDENDDAKAFAESAIIDVNKLQLSKGELRNKLADLILGDRHTIFDIGANKTSSETLKALCDSGMIFAINLIIIPLMDGEQDALNAATTYFYIRDIAKKVPIIFALNRHNTSRDIRSQFDNFLGDERGFFDEGGVIANFQTNDRLYITLADSDVIKYARKFGISVYELAKMNKDLEGELKIAIETNKDIKEIKYLSFKLSLQNDAQTYLRDNLKDIFKTLDEVLFHE